MARPYVAAELRRLVSDRAGGYCEYCKFPVKFALESMEVDHTFPFSLGGKTIAENLALACHGCNQNKQNRIEGVDLLSSAVAELYNPRTMVWKDHFGWSQDTTLIVGKTATGRVTVRLLKMNRLGLVNLRGVLERSGEHPPEG
jgi:HNH endonuclease